MRAALVLTSLAALAGCGRSGLGDGAPAPDAAPPDGSAGDVARTPLNHREKGDVCSVDRAPGALPACVGSTNPGSIRCRLDTDCTGGLDGRCLVLSPACVSQCSYDECASDADCAAGEPCLCRDSGSPASPNVCLSGGDCRVDADCGPGGFCSPSQLDPWCTCPSPLLCTGGGGCFDGSMQVPCACGDACGHAYYCHTKNDACLDDADCGGETTCNYDILEKRWTCSECWPIP